jgi:UDP-glucose 4-epimerase
MNGTIIIGGSGFIGRQLIKHLIAEGRDVQVVGRSLEPRYVLPKGCRYYSCNYGDVQAIRKILTSESEVIDLAYSTVPKTSFEDPLYDLASNLPNSVAFLQESARIGVKKVLIVSSGGTVYGPATFLPITENHPTRPISPYGITKLAIDCYAMMYFRNAGLPIVIVRPSNAYGEDQRTGSGQGFLAAAIRAVLEARDIDIYGEKGTIRDYIHVSDVALGIQAALSSGKEGNIYNIGTGIGSTNMEVLSMLRCHAVASGLDVRVRLLPARGFDVDANILDSTHLRNDTGWAPKIDLFHGISMVWNNARKFSS